MQRRHWGAGTAAMLCAGAIAMVGLDSPAQAQTSGKTLTIITANIQAWSGPVGSVTIGNNSGGGYFVLVVGSPAQTGICGLNVGTLSDALLLRAQITDAKTTSVECTDNAVRSGKTVNLTNPLGAYQSFRINGGP